MKYLKPYINFHEENSNEIFIEPTINDIIQNDDEYTITIGDTTTNGIYSGDLYSENLPKWAKKRVLYGLYFKKRV